MTIFIICLISLILTLAFSGILGYKLNFAKIHDPFHQIFMSICIGIIAIISAYAIATTSFKTINLFFLILFIPLIFKYRNHQQQANTKLKTIIASLIALCPFFCINLFKQTLGFHSLELSPYLDANFYIDISNGLNLYGEENYYNSLNINKKYHGNTPYHYFELWMSALLSKISTLDIEQD